MKRCTLLILAVTSLTFTGLLACPAAQGQTTDVTQEIWQVADEMLSGIEAQCLNPQPARCHYKSAHGVR
jgi:hypothetical protein